MSDARRAARLLYVEGDLVHLPLVETILWEPSRWRITPAMQGRIALDLAREHQPDLILMDTALPDMAPVEFLRSLHEDARTAHIPVVVLTADSSRARVEPLLDAGAQSVLLKPIRVLDFEALLCRLLDAPGGAPAAP